MINAEARKLVAQLNKKFKSDVVVFASDIRSDIIPRITSGSTTLDYVLGGVIRVGKMVNSSQSCLGD